MAGHHEILRAAIRICSARKGWRFRPVEIVNALPHLDPGTVRTHVVSRCCVNAPAHHPHRWPYFERISRGVYEIRRPFRDRPVATPKTRPRVAERQAVYSTGPVPRDTVHAAARRSGAWYVGECLEIAVVTQARTLNELTENLREAVDLHLDGEDPAATGVVGSPRLSLTIEILPTS